MENNNRRTALERSVKDYWGAGGGGVIDHCILFTIYCLLLKMEFNVENEMFRLEN